MESKSTAKLSASENAPAFSEFELQHDTSGVNDAGVTLEVTNAALEQPVFVQGQPQVHYASKEHPDFSALVDQPSSEWRVVWDHPTQNGHFWHPHSDQTSLPNPTMPSGATWKVLYDLGERAWYFWNNSTGVSQWRNPHLTEDFLGEIGKEEQALLLSAAWPSEATLREHQHDSLDWRPMWDVVQQAWYFHSCASRKTQWANPSANAQAVWYPMWYCDGGKEMWFFHDPVKQVSQWENPYFQPPEVLATKLRGPEAEAAVEPLLSKIEREVVKLTKPTTPEDNISSEVAALADKKRKAIYEDRVKCSNALRSMVQGPGFCNEALLLFPGDSCRYGPEERDKCEVGGNHLVWPTSGELKTNAACEIKCQYCGFVANGKGRKAAGYLRLHIKTHTGENFNPKAPVKDRQIWTGVMQGFNPPLQQRVKAEDEGKDADE